MRLNEWLNENSKRLSSDLSKKSQKNLPVNGILEYTTHTQIVSVLKDLRSLILPGVFDHKPIDNSSLDMYLDIKINSVATQLSKVIQSVLVHECYRKYDPMECVHQAEDITKKILEKLPIIKDILDTDIAAAFDGDPAAKSYEEVILSYPSIEAISIYRIAHLLYSLDVPIVPRIMTEYAHKNTGIDIHPGATIGNRFFIDHGTGVVIGETCTIKNNVKLYQGVTLGAKSFPLDEHGNPIKGIKRHPNIEDNVVIYAGATILGGDTSIGHDSVVGGNVWLTESVPPNSKVFNTPPGTIIKSS